MKAYTWYRRTAVAVIFVNHELSLLNVFFQSYNREINAKTGIVESIKQLIFSFVNRK